MPELTELQKKCIEESIQRNYPNNPKAQNAFRVAEGLPTIEEEKFNEAKSKLGILFDTTKEVLSEYLDIPEEHRTIIALWIVGTYFHEQFSTFPYLFINAMRGSGKTRALKLITTLAKEGQLLASITESVLFRCRGTLAIDEFESIGGKEKQALRELLNAGYKKGIKIRRMKKVHKKNELGMKEETQEAEEFDAYRPIVMANIWGMDEVVEDRCISLIFEKSSNPNYTLIVEDYDFNPKIRALKDDLSRVSVVLVSFLHSVVSIENMITGWNRYVKDRHLTTLIHQTTLNSTEQHQMIVNDSFYNKIAQTNIDGRHLELFFPLFVLAKLLSEELLSKILETAKKIVTDKREDEIMESKDVMLYNFISRMDYETDSWISEKELLGQFQEFIGEEGLSRDEKWLDSRWLGKALKRLSLVKAKRRMGRGRDVILNKAKADDKMKIFHK